MEGLGDLIDGYEFHYPQELSPRTSTRCATRSVSTTSTAWRPGSISTRASAAAASSRLTRPRARGGSSGRSTRRVRRLARRALHRLAGDRGLQLPVPDALRRQLGLAHRRYRAGGRGVRAARREALPRAQELRAAMKILMRNIGMTLHVIHKLRAEGIDNVQVNMDWQHLIMNRENLAEYAALLAGRGPARPPARELGLGRFRRRQHRRRDRVHGDAGAGRRAAPAGYGAGGERLGFDLYPYTEDAGRRRPVAACSSGGSSTASPRRSTTRPCARRRRRRTPCAPTSSSTPPSEREAGRAGRRDDRRQGSRPLADGGRAREAERGYPLSTPQPGWAEQDPEAGGARARRRCATSAGRGEPLGFVRADARARRARRGRRGAAAGDPLERPAHRRRVRRDRAARRPRAIGRAHR